MRTKLTTPIKHFYDSLEISCGLALLGQTACMNWIK